VIGVGQQLEAQTFLCTELLVGVGVLHTDAKHDGTFLLVPRLVALKVVCLDRAAASEVFGVEVQDDPLAAIVLQTYGCTLLRGSVNSGAMLPTEGTEAANAIHGVTAMAATKIAMITTRCVITGSPAMLAPLLVHHQLNLACHFAEHQLHIADIAFSERPFAVSQVVVPHAHEALVEPSWRISARCSRKRRRHSRSVRL